ncbi:MAG: ABC transporter ATP-binding protein [Segniliparus sp.]|uniref:ABC transporter ATP-binding protein n=1 Tax=Segniliparus sp. TaxID=2804064 RepID=UPI003F3E782E
MVGQALDIVDVSFQYPGQGAAVLDHVSVSAKPGELVALVGPSGCGKSTLLRLAAGLERPSQGAVYADGRVVGRPHPSRAVVFQDPTLLPWRTVRANVALGPQARGRQKEEAALVDEALGRVGLADFADAFPAQLSGGMAQRVALARALVGDPAVLLMDEPFGKLDALTRETMQDELLGLWQANKFTVLLVTHDVDEAVKLADRVVVFSPRPARTVGEFAATAPRPRAYGDPDWLRLRAQIRGALNAEGAR